MQKSRGNSYFSCNAENLGPHHPEGAVPRNVAHRLVGGPAALLHVEVEGAGTDAELEVGEPGGADVDDARHHARRDADQQDADPARPGVVRPLQQLPQAVLLFLHDISGKESKDYYISLFLGEISQQKCVGNSKTVPVSYLSTNYRTHLTLILAAILLGHCVTAFSSKCLPEEVYTATSRLEGPLKRCRIILWGC